MICPIPKRRNPLEDHILRGSRVMEPHSHGWRWGADRSINHSTVIEAVTHATPLSNSALVRGSIVLLGWVVKHTEPSTNVGLRHIAQAEQIERGGWHEGLFQGIDHPLYPLGIAAVHRLFDGEGPASWQRAALLLSFGAAVLLVIPIYLLTLELVGENAAWLAAALVMINPSTGFIVVNVSSETSFLVWWSFGLWASVRFLREGQFRWLPPAVGFGLWLISHARKGCSCRSPWR